MINFNGTLQQEENILTHNRAFLYGDGVFETVKIIDNKILFLEDHYFRLMASMRIVRMEIPMEFTMEFLEGQILNTATQNGVSNSARARITVFRNDGGRYLPVTNDVSYLISVSGIENQKYQTFTDAYEVDLFKDFYVTKQLLSSIKSTNRQLNVVASIYANENALDNCLLLNDSKNVVEGLQGNLFMVLGNKIVTPPVSEGCLNGVMRKQVIALLKKETGLTIEEQIISPFDLQKADELFLTNVVFGVRPITKYRKKEFKTEIAHLLVGKINESIA